jgi:hypothetical protein
MAETLMDANFMTLIFILGLVSSVVAGAVVKYAVEKRISKKSRPKCGRGECGEFGWSIVRKDSDTCHAVCKKCGWTSHFDVKRQQVD